MICPQNKFYVLFKTIFPVLFPLFCYNTERKRDSEGVGGRVREEVWVEGKMDRVREKFKIL